MVWAAMRVTRQKTECFEPFRHLVVEGDISQMEGVFPPNSVYEFVCGILQECVVVKLACTTKLQCAFLSNQVFDDDRDR